MHGAHTCDGSKSPLAWIIIGKHIKTLDKKPVKVTWKIFRNVAAENVANCTKDLCSLPCQTCHWPCRQSTRCRGAARPASPPRTWPKLIILQLIIFYSLCFSRQLGEPKKIKWECNFPYHNFSSSTAYSHAHILRVREESMLKDLSAHNWDNLHNLHNLEYLHNLQSSHQYFGENCPHRRRIAQQPHYWQRWRVEQASEMQEHKSVLLSVVWHLNAKTKNTELITNKNTSTNIEPDRVHTFHVYQKNATLFKAQTQNIWAVKDFEFHAESRVTVP